MKKLFKTLTVVLIAAIAATVCAFALTACGDEKAEGYSITVVDKNGAALNGKTGGANGGAVALGICLIDGACIPLPSTVTLDENGKITLTQSEINNYFSVLSNAPAGDVTKFTFHVQDVPGHNADCEFEIDGAKPYTFKLYV